MKMSELILAVGDENVVFQNLLNDEEVLFDKNKKIGLVLWLPRDRVEAALADERRAAE